MNDDKTPKLFYLTEALLGVGAVAALDPAGDKAGKSLHKELSKYPGYNGVEWAECGKLAVMFDFTVPGLCPTLKELPKEWEGCSVTYRCHGLPPL